MMMKLLICILSFVLLLGAVAIAEDVEWSTPEGVLHMKNKSFDDSDDARKQILDLFQGLRVADVSDAMDRVVLRKGASPYEIVEPRHLFTEIKEAPFFFQDRRHVFFVRSSLTRVSVGEALDVLISRPPVLPTEPPEVILSHVSGPPKEATLVTGLVMPGPIDPRLGGLVLVASPYVHRVMDAGGGIQFGNRFIGPGGSVPFEGSDG